MRCPYACYCTAVKKPRTPCMIYHLVSVLEYSIAQDMGARPLLGACQIKLNILCGSMARHAQCYRTVSIPIQRKTDTAAIPGQGPPTQKEAIWAGGHVANSGPSITKRIGQSWACSGQASFVKQWLNHGRKKPMLWSHDVFRCTSLSRTTH